MREVDQEQWSKLRASVRELSGAYGERLVFIGGVAVYLHVRVADLPDGFVEYSHDADFYISLSDMNDLKDWEVVTPNRRLSKYQIIKDGADFDVYLENHSELIVGYRDAAAASVVVEGVRVASLEHLLLLKLDAYRDRRGSAKGRKDERDLIRVCYLLSRRNLRQERLSKYLTVELVRALELVQKSPEFLAVCGNNAHEARKLRDAFSRTLNRVAAVLEVRR